MLGLEYFEYIAQKDPCELFRFVIDRKKQETDKEQTVLLWEKREPGSIRNMFKAYEHLIPFIREKRPLTTADILEIHKLAANHLNNPGRFRDLSTDYAFNLVEETFSQNGLQELIEYCKENPCHIKNVFFHAAKSDKDKLDALIAEYQSYQCIRFFPYNGDLSEKEITAYFFAKNALFGIKNTNSSDSYIKKYHENISQKINQILSTCYTELNRAINTQDKIFLIVNAVQQLERMHPFSDGNCRVFGTLLLNCLLMQYDLPPTLLYDPNQFDGYSAAEMVEQIQEGMKKTEELIIELKTGRIPRSFSSNHEKNEVSQWAESLIKQLNTRPSSSLAF